MELTRAHIQQKIAQYRQQADRLKSDAIANQGAADALGLLLADMDAPASKAEAEAEVVKPTDPSTIGT